MGDRPRIRFFFQRAPAKTGAVFCAAISLALASCGKRGQTPDWSHPENTEPATQSGDPSPHSPAAPAAAAKAPPLSRSGLRFISYNVRNWLTTDRYVDGKRLRDSSKPETEKHAVVRLLAGHRPDVIGICEIGTASDLADLQQRLGEAGLELPHSHYTGGSDPVRHLALLSRFPITATARPESSSFQLQGRSFTINRGILDATVGARGKSYRFLGVHLKSKRESPDVDQEQMRIHEARLLRRHIDAIQNAEPDARLVVYGDFNDTRKTKAVTTIAGRYRSPGHLTAVWFKDSRGHAWTHHWALQDIYSRIDFVTLSKSLRPEIDIKASRVIDDPDWQNASDHRPLLAIFK